MKTSELNIEQKLSIKKIRPFWLLLAGIVTMTSAHLNYNIDLAAWISMVPFLIYLTLTKGWKSRLLFVLSLIASWTFIVLKIVTPPIPGIFIFMYSLPISLIHLSGYLLWSKFKDRRFSIFLFPVVMTTMEWIQYTYTPLASWGVAAYTQSESIAIMQFVSIFGMAGLSFLIYWVNVSIADIITSKKRTILNFALPLFLTALVMVFGALRYDFHNASGVDTIKIAAVGTDSEIGGLPLPSNKKNEKDIVSILERTRKAADLGVKIVIWNEASFLLRKNNEDQWVNSFMELADKSEVSIVACYILLTSESPLRYENKYVMINSRGEIVHSYLKHQPVPGEPAKKGTGIIKTRNIEGVNLGGAICYDYDFPYLARENGAANADIVALPSSDWRGIDPIHTQMACFRAIEQGHAVLRSTRFGLSAAITPYGDMTSKMSSFSSKDKIMIAELPKIGISTVYSKIGDLFVYICLILIPILLSIKKK